MGQVLLSRERRFGVFGSRSGGVLTLLLAATLMASVVGRRQVDDLAADEITIVAASQSLAFDGDLGFNEADEQRLEQLSMTSAGPILRDSGDGTSQLDAPLPYALLLAPLARWAPLRGPIVINALLLVVTAWLAVRHLHSRVGDIAAGAIAVCVFASVFYRNVFVVQPTLLLTTLVALAFALAYHWEEPAEHGLQEIYRPPDAPVIHGARALLVGGLLGLVILHQPIYALMALPAAVAWPRQKRALAAGMVVAGAAAVVVIAALTSGLWGGSVNQWLEHASDSIRHFSVGLSMWNLLYGLVGRNTGILPYFLPLLALLGLWQGGSRRSVLALTAVTGIVAFLVLQPFDYYGGPAAVGNRWLLPWFVMLWFVPTRPLPRGWVVATLVLAVPAMIPTWLTGDIEPLTSDGVYRQAAGPLHRRWLPVETTQRYLPPPGQSVGERFWVRSLSLEATTGGGNRWRLAGDEWCELQLATPVPLESVYLQFGRQAEPQLEVRGAEVGDTVLLADGGVGFRLEDLDRKALHPMWWSQERYYNYLLQLRMPMADPRPQSLVLTAIAQDVGEERP